MGHEDLSNWERGDLAATALQKYFDEMGYDPISGTYGDEGSALFEIAMTDLLTDLEHLAHRAGVDYERILSDARANWETEDDTDHKEEEET